MPIGPLYTKALSDLTTLLRTLESLSPQLQKLADLMMSTWDAGNKLLICGNGGSAADAMHFAEELVGRYGKNRRALSAIPLTDPTAITCIANDFGFDRIFARQVEAFGKPGDLLIVLSVSGNSPNILHALDAAKQLGLKTAALLGRDGGQAKGRCDVELLVPHTSSGRVQECHKLLYHTLCEWVDSKTD